MNIEIKRLSADIIIDYINFFDNVAFTDNPEWSGCYCVWYHWNDLLEKEREKYEELGGKNFKRELAIKYIQKGILQGYLAYHDGLVVGWCNANDKVNYDRFCKDKSTEIWDDDYSKKIKSIVCFTIAPNIRQKGISTQLLKRVCDDAKLENYDFIEAYPGIGEVNYHGSYSIYDKLGFTLHKNLGRDAIVRKYL
jgi:GNAT superfamily N-acetyltransferase